MTNHMIPFEKQNERFVLAGLQVKNVSKVVIFVDAYFLGSKRLYFPLCMNFFPAITLKNRRGRDSEPYKIIPPPLLIVIFYP